jgi:hypothetical protein
VQQVEHEAIKREKRRANQQLEEERGQRRKKRHFQQELDTYVVALFRQLFFRLYVGVFMLLYYFESCLVRCVCVLQHVQSVSPFLSRAWLFNAPAMYVYRQTCVVPTHLAISLLVSLVWLCSCSEVATGAELIKTVQSRQRSEADLELQNQNRRLKALKVQLRGCVSPCRSTDRDVLRCV